MIWRVIRKLLLGDVDAEELIDTLDDTEVFAEEVEDWNSVNPVQGRL